MAAEDAEPLDEVRRYRRLCAAFDRLFELDTEQRAAALANLPDDEHDLAEELAAMLAASDTPLLQPQAERGDDALTDDHMLHELGEDRGWRVLRELGRGGMGRVLLAERADGRFNKQVAIKVLDRSPDDADWRRRFAAEREILARLQHPGIVRLLDAGETRSGVPYLVMEYVSGQTLEHVLRHGKTTQAERLALFEQVAGAVAYAHRMLIAHRDLKPGNILVDAEQRAHLLDFGIARLLSEGNATATQARALTPRYAAPEQVAGQAGTTALDVYQLGIMLYELLAGAPPFAALNGPALLRAILEQDPPPPSAVAAIPSSIDADLDAICLRALRKEPEQRYASVDALLADLVRWRQGEPVLAHAGGTLYRTRKFLVRHWRALGALTLVIVLIGGFIWRLDRELERSERERAVAEQATELMVDVIGRADPSRAQGEELTLREALNQSVERLRGTPDLEPIVRARVLESVGATFVELSSDAAALPVLAESAAAFSAAGDADGEQRALHARSVALMNLGNYAVAQAAIEEVLAKRTRLGLRGDAFEAELHSTLGILHQYQRKTDLALAEFDEALRIQRSMTKPDPEQLLHTLRNLGDIRSTQGDLPGGLAALEEARVLSDRIHGADHPDSIRLLRSLGRNAQRRGELAEALTWFEDGWARAQKVFQPPHSMRLLLGHPLAMARLEQGRTDEALTLMRQMIGEARQAFPANHPSLGTIAADMALIELLAGNDQLARPFAVEALTIRKEIADTDSGIAQTELIIAVVDCRARTAASKAVQATLERALADPLLSKVLSESYRQAASLCPKPTNDAGR